MIPLALAAAIVAIPAAPAAAREGGKPKKIKPCVERKKPVKGKKKKRRVCGDVRAVALPRRWQVVAVDVVGTTTARDESEDFDFRMRGTTTIRSNGSDKSGRFQQPEKGVAVATLSPVRTAITSRATWSDEQAGIYDCDRPWPAGSLPTILNTVVVPSHQTKGALIFRWSFLPSGWSPSCVRHDGASLPAPSPPPAPSDLGTASYPASAFRDAPRKASIDLVVDQRRRWSDGTIRVTQTWRGKVELRPIGGR
ncbi:hypothetical protein [Patulibacter defluvii]|uniref:hypothetical protein n=1 Tax=Patulibacter defluvii TaxID=3095358 RepID=UPI002A75FDA6|nr:hypothetical protein [Patulibacter sp. DM4]